MTRKYAIRFVALFLILVSGLRVLTFFSQPPSNLGVNNGKLAECPDSPNCVSSQVARNKSQYIRPLRLAGDPPNALDKLAHAVDELPRTTLVTESADYLHFEFRSLVFGFVDDVEFLRDVAGGVIHVRSASRFGYSDMGKNRKRIERIREIWQSLN